MERYGESKLDSGENFGIHNCEFKSKVRMRLKLICNKDYITKTLTFVVKHALFKIRNSFTKIIDFETFIQS